MLYFSFRVADKLGKSKMSGAVVVLDIADVQALISLNSLACQLGGADS